MSDQQKAERAFVMENNRAWRAAETVRRQYLSTLCSRRTPPGGAAIFVATELVHGDDALRRAMERPDLFASVLGESSADRSALAESLCQVTENRAQVVSLACVLAAIEQSTSVETSQTATHAVGRYLRFLADTGYELSPIEKQAGAKRWSRRQAA